MRKVMLRLMLVLFGLGCGLVAAEVGLRLVYADGSMPAAHLQQFSPDVLATFQSDPECGYLPVTGTGEYSPEGCIRNNYRLDSRQGRRVLFVGDSVTHRGTLVEALRQAYGDQGYEYWNAGVESFNTRQELVFYRKFNQAIKPDLVVLTFHNNDYTATPLAVREHGHLRVYSPGMDINPWLFEKSYLYRWLWPRTEQGDRRGRAAMVADSLAGFQSLLQEQKVPFRVILLPLLKPYAQWDEAERWSREQALGALKSQRVEYFDLLPTLEQALSQGVQAEETKGDTWHPSQAISQRFAQVLKNQGLLR